MTATAQPFALDVSDTRPVPLSRLVAVEIRKMADTRAGKWLLIAIAAVTVLVTVAMFIWGEDDSLTFLNLLSFAGLPQGLLLPVLAILLVTQEWGQRTGLVTFTLVPHRGRVMTAKLVAALAFVLAALAVAMLIAIVLAPFSPAGDPWEGYDAGVLARVTLGVLIGAVWGFAFGAALLNSAFAIVAYFAVPTVVSIVASIWTSAHDALAWIDLSASSGLLFELDSPTGKEWAQIGTGFVVWVLLPLVVGFVRVLRSEVK